VEPALFKVPSRDEMSAETKADKITRMLRECGFIVRGDLISLKGPKVKSDILECWHASAIRNGRKVEIYSAYTMTDLCKHGLEVEPNRPNTCLYGDYVAVPKDRLNFYESKRLGRT
jgi:hypothetical protein